MKFKAFAKLALLTAAIAAVIIAPISAIAGYEPANRPVKTYNGPDTPAFQYPVFNSWVNTPYYGDERAFADAATTTNGQYKDMLAVAPGQEITLRMYIHNGAAPGLNGNNFDGPGVARNARIQVYLPTATSTQLRSYSYIIADNTNPGWVADSVDYNSSVPVNMEFVPGSARLANRAHPGGVALPDSIVNHNAQFNANAPAAPIGYEQMDGNYPGCFQYDAFVTLKVRINGPSLAMSKQVTTPGSTNWSENLDLTINDPSQTPTASWLLEYKNTSNVMVTNGVVRDTLPANLKLVPGSVMHFDGNHPQGIPVADNGLFEGGVGVGNIAPNGGNGYFRFRTTVHSPFNEQQCGTQKIPNVAEVEATGVPKVKDDASVTVKKDQNCEKPSGLICKNLKVNLSPANATLPNKPTFVGTAEQSGEGAIKPSKYEYHISKVEGDKVTPMPNSPVVSESSELTNTVNEAYTFTEAGNYRVELKVFDQDGHQVQGDPACTQNFTLSQTPPPPQECLPGIPVGDPRCNPVPPSVPPTTPTSSSLPQTGIETGLLGVIGSSAMTIGAIKYRRSKKAVAEALLNRSER